MNIASRNNVTIRGRGDKTMVMAHGFGCDQTVWRHLADAFAEDHRVVLFDYVGSGESDARAYDERRYGSLDGYMNDVLELVDDLELRDVIFVGHSISSMIGALAAVHRPERFAELVMIAPSPRYLNDPPSYAGGFERGDVQALLNMMEHNYNGWAHHMAPVAMQNEARPELSDELAGQFGAMDPFIARRFAEVTFLSDNRAVLPKIPTRTLVLQCSDDAIVPPAVGDYLAHHIPNATLQRMQATGHCPHLSQPGETIQLIREHLADAVA